MTFNHDLDLCKYGTVTNLSLNAACRSQALFMLLLSGIFCNLHCQPIGFIVFYTKFDIYVTKILHIHFSYLCVKTEIFKLDKNQTFYKHNFNYKFLFLIVLNDTQMSCGFVYNYSVYVDTKFSILNDKSIWLVSNVKKSVFMSYPNEYLIFKTYCIIFYKAACIQYNLHIFQYC